MRISDWSSDVCSSDLGECIALQPCRTRRDDRAGCRRPTRPRAALSGTACSPSPDTGPWRLLRDRSPARRGYRQRVPAGHELNRRLRKCEVMTMTDTTINPNRALLEKWDFTLLDATMPASG